MHTRHKLLPKQNSPTGVGESLILVWAMVLHTYDDMAFDLEKIWSEIFGHLHTISHDVSYMYSPLH